MALRTTLARLAQPLRAQSAAFSAIPTPRPKYTERQEKLGLLRDESVESAAE